jgi:release factor glutamine methyltransferase
MTISYLKQFNRELWQTYSNDFKDNYPGINQFILESFIESFFNKSPFSLNRLECLKQNLIDGKPLAYISNQTFFYDVELYVDQRVLIPRQETELLFDYALKYIKNMSVLNVDLCEIGVGSGAIYLSLLTQTNDKVINGVACDISEDALAVFKLNLNKLNYRFNPQHTTEIVQSDLFENIKGHFDIIVSNPPYIKAEHDKKLVHQQVLRFEPYQALFLEDDQYNEWFKRFFYQVNDHLKPDGVFLMEGHEEHLLNLKSMLKDNHGGQVEILKDLTGRDRFLKWEKNNG